MDVTQLKEVCDKTESGRQSYDTLMNLVLVARVRLTTIASSAIGADDSTKEAVRIEYAQSLEEFRSMVGEILMGIKINPSEIKFPGIIDDICNMAA